MNRRGFLTGILLTVTTPKAQAQQPAKVHRVAVIAATTPLRPTPIDPVARTFVESLLAFGYTPENLVLERRSAEGAIERVPQIGHCDVHELDYSGCQGGDADNPYRNAGSKSGGRRIDPQLRPTWWKRHGGHP
jgi:hypothetical protein